MKIAKLRTNLSELGADVSERTLRSWASKRWIPGPAATPRKTRRTVGRPRLGAQNKSTVERGSPGRYYEWPQESYEDAAAVWTISHIGRRSENGQTTSKVDITQIRLVARHLYEDLRKDPDSANFGLHDVVKPSDNLGLDRRNRDLAPLVVLWITAIEKSRKKEQLDTPVKAVFQWLGHTFKQELFILTSQEVDDVKNSLELRLCDPEVPYIHNTEDLSAKLIAYKPGRCQAKSLFEDGSFISRSFLYYPPDELILRLALTDDGRGALRAYKEYTKIPTDEMPYVFQISSTNPVLDWQKLD